MKRRFFCCFFRILLLMCCEKYIISHNISQQLISCISSSGSTQPTGQPAFSADRHLRLQLRHLGALRLRPASCALPSCRACKLEATKPSVCYGRQPKSSRSSGCCRSDENVKTSQNFAEIFTFFSRRSTSFAEACSSSSAATFLAVLRRSFRPRLQKTRI